MLGELGADVVKVEPPEGDSSRQVGPGASSRMGALFLACNRHKRSLALDLKDEGALRALRTLIDRADVFLHNLRPAAVDRLGLDSATLRGRNPRLVYCGAYGYARSGPYGDRPAFDDSIQAESGLAALGSGDPVFVPTIAADKVTAIVAAYNILAALFARERTGQGREIEVPMLETMVSFLMVEHLQGRTFDPPRGDPGYPRVLSRNRKPHRTGDGWLAVLPYTDAQWAAFCRVVERQDLVVDPRFRSMAARLDNVDALYGEIGRSLASRPSAEWREAFTAAQVPFSTVNSLDDLFDDAHLAATGFWRTFDHPTEGRLRAPAPFGRFSGLEPASGHAPRLGAHSIEVLRSTGLDESFVAELVRRGAVVVERGDATGADPATIPPTE